MAALSDRHTVKKSSFVQRRCIECDILDFGSEREFSAPGKCVSVKRPRAKSTQVDRSVAGLPLPPPTPPMHGFWRFEHVCLHAKQNPTVRVHTGSGEREAEERERGMEREERGESARGIGGDFILGKRFFWVCVCVCSSWVWSKVSLIVLSLTLSPSLPISLSPTQFWLFLSSAHFFYASVRALAQAHSQT